MRFLTSLHITVVTKIKTLHKMYMELQLCKEYPTFYQVQKISNSWFQIIRKF